jgi:hypothetical protein
MVIVLGLSLHNREAGTKGKKEKKRTNRRSRGGRRFYILGEVESEEH